MSSDNKEWGDDRNHQSHEEIIEMKSLFKMLLESQNKQAESLAKLGDTQANIQQQLMHSQNKQAESMVKLAVTQENTQRQIIEILKSSNSDGSKLKQQGDIASSGSVDKQEIPQVPDNDDEEPELEGGQVALYVPGKHDLLYQALKHNDVVTVTRYLNTDPWAVVDAISFNRSTALHMAMEWNQTSIVKQIVRLLRTPIILECKRTSSGQTALHLAAFRGNVEAAVVMVDKHPRLTQIRDFERRTPLENALQIVSAGQKEIVEYLYSKTEDTEPSPFWGQDGARLLCSAIDTDFYDLALRLVKRFPKLPIVKSRKHGACGWELLVRKPYAFGIGSKLTWLQDRFYSLIQVDMCATRSNSIFTPYWGRVSWTCELYKLKLMHKQAIALLKQMIVELQKANSLDEIMKFFENNPDIIKVAIKHGINVFVAECLDPFGVLIWREMSGQRMLDMAVIERNVTMVNLICDYGNIFEDKTTLVCDVDYDGNTILHHAAKLASPAHLNLIPGVALQIQRELQWLKGIESIMPENEKFRKNKEGYTAQILFTKEHKELLKEGEDWMKDTSGSCMIVAALIATVAFAAAFTVPGGNISDSNSSKNGTPVFLGKNSFTVFAAADAFALFSSITSVLMFLSIYTSRYAEIDFLKSLPQKLIIGLATLFISMAAILVAFCASLFIVVGSKFPRGLVPITLFGCVPVVLFAWLQLPLFCEMVRSTYWGSLFQKHKYIDPRVEKKNYN